MRQPTQQTRNKAKNRRTKPKMTKPKFGTSKLETDFAKNFLDKLNVKYIWQFEAKDIKRFYDYYLPEHNIILEIDGSFWHADPRVVKESKLTPTQKRNRRVDDLKNRWALMHGIPIMRIWEKDIRENPEQVMRQLKERLRLQSDKIRLDNEKKKRH